MLLIMICDLFHLWCQLIRLVHRYVKLTQLLRHVIPEYTESRTSEYQGNSDPFLVSELSIY